MPDQDPTDPTSDSPAESDTDELSAEDMKRGGDMLLGLGHEMYKREHFIAARKVLNRAIELDPQLIPAFLVQSLVCRELNESMAAVHFAAQAAKLDPKRVDALMLLTQAMLEAGMLQQAIPLLQQMQALPNAAEWATQVLNEIKKANLPSDDSAADSAADDTEDSGGEPD